MGCTKNAVLFFSVLAAFRDSVNVPNAVPGIVGKSESRQSRTLTVALSWDLLRRFGKRGFALLAL